MATGKITTETVRSVGVPMPGKREYLWDETLKGFGVMVTDKGQRSFIVQYRVGGRGHPTRRVTIGKVGSPWTAKSARDRAATLLEQVRCKVDPFDAAQAAIQRQRDAKRVEAASAAILERLGFSTFADRFVDKYAKVNQPRSWKETEGVINRDLKPAFGDRALTDISDSDIAELLDKLGERGVTPALKAYKALRLLYGYASDKERRHLPASKSPMLAIKPPIKAGKMLKRQRTLTDEELRLVWQAAGGLGWPFGPIVRLLILTAQRRDEVAGLSWKEIDAARKHWLLPAERAKNGIANLVPLSAAALSIITDLPRLGGKAQLLFTTTGETAVSGFSKVKARLDASMLDLMRKAAREAGADEEAVADLKVDHWTLHDLRRTAATGLQSLGIPTEVTEATLNHVSGSKAGIVGVYQTFKFEREKRAALDAWAAKVAAIASGKPMPINVVAMERRA